MANAKISNNTIFPPETTDVRNIDGLAGYKGAGNVKISGTFLVQSVINSNGSGTASTFAESRLAFYGTGGTSLGGSTGMTWDQNTDTLNIGTPNSAAGLEADVKLHGTYVSGSDQPKLTFVGGNSVDGDFDFQLTTSTDGSDQTWILPEDVPADTFFLQASNINGNEIELDWKKVALSNGDNQVTGVLSVQNGGIGVGSLTKGNLLVGDGTDAISTLNAKGKGKLVVGRTVTSGPVTGDSVSVINVGTNGQVLTANSAIAEYGVEWADLPSASVSSFTNLTPGDVVKWDYSVDGPNIELITTQDPDPAITRDNVITMWDNTTNTASDISDIPDGATGTLIVHPTANPYFNFPTGSKLSDASNIRLDGATKVLRWIKEGNGADPSLSPTAPGYGCLYWAGFENFATASLIEGPDVDAAITDNLYGWWDPNDYTASVLGDDGSSLGVVNNSTLPSTSAFGLSTGNSLTVDNEETTADEAYEHIEWVNFSGSNYSFDFKVGGTNFLFSNDTVNPANNRYTIMVWFRSDFSGDTSDLGLFNASITGSSMDSTLASGIRVDDATSSSLRRLEFRGRDSNNWETKYQNFANNEWTCLIMAFDPVKDDGAGGTYAEIRHLIANQYTETNAGNSISGSGIVSDGDSITINADGTYIDFLYDAGDINDPSDGSDAASDLVASDIIEQFTGFQFARSAAPYFSTYDWNGEIGLCCLWDGEAKSDADMQTIYDYSKTKFGIT